MLSALFRTLGLGTDDEARHETETVAEIATVLTSLPPERARLLAAFTYLLGRVAFADHEVSDAERAVMETRLATEGDVSAAQAQHMLSIASWWLPRAGAGPSSPAASSRRCSTAR